jgi:hypothetical protein
MANGPQTYPAWHEFWKAIDVPFRIARQPMDRASEQEKKRGATRRGSVR